MQGKLKMNNKFLNLIMLIVIVVFAINANAFSLTIKQNELLGEIARKGYVDQKIHNEFWQEFKVKPTEKEMKVIRDQAIQLINLNIIVYDAAKESALKKKPQYNLAKSAIDYYKNNKMQTNYEQTLAILEHASDGKPMSFNGKQTYITLDSIEIAKENWCSRRDRIYMLLREKWDPIPKEVIINKNVSILWPFDFYKKELEKDQNSAEKSPLYYAQMGEHTATFIISYTSDMKQNENDRAGSCIKRGTTLYGLDNIEPSFEQLNGDVMATATYKTESTERNYFLNVACVVHNDQLVFFGAVSDKSWDSISQFGELRRNINIH